MAVELGTGYISVVPESKGFASALTSSVGGPMAAAGTQVGGIFSGGLASAITTIAPIAAVAAIGGAALAAAMTVDDAYDTIRVGTGATGKELQGLQKDFKAVFSGIPTNAQDAGTAVADLNTRLGLTGKPLQDMSKNILEMSRITKTDLGTNIQSVTRVFGDWGVEQKDSTKRLNELYRTSQLTGIGVGDLAGQMVQFGAPLREMGFSFSESAAMMGKFEKEGVNAQLVLGGMKMGLGRLAKEGKNPREEFDKLSKSIDTAGLTAENKQKVFEMFGARAGIDMAKAIEEGRFKFGDLVKSIESGSDTIMKSAEDTKDFPEMWQEFKNVATLAIEPLGKAILSVLNPAMQGLLTVGRNLAPMFTSIGGVISGFSIGANKDISGFTSVFQAVGQIVGQIVAFAKPLILDMANFFTQQFGVISGWVRTNWPLIQQTITVVMNAIKAVFDIVWPYLSIVVKTAWNLIKVIVSTVLSVVLGIIKTVMQIITGDWSGAWETIKGIVKTVFSGVVKIVGTIINGVLDVLVTLKNSAVTKLTALWDYITSIPGRAYGWGKAIIQSLWDGMKSIFSSISRWFTDNVLPLINKLNPFARHSPSLVDNVKAGLKVIEQEYSSLKLPEFNMSGIAQPAIAGPAAQSQSRQQIINVYPAQQTLDERELARIWNKQALLYG